MRIGIICLTDDPFDPPGVGAFGGSHKVMFDMGRHFVRRGASVTYITRRNAPAKPTHEELGPRCNILRLSVGAPSPIAYHKCAVLIPEMIAAIRQDEQPLSRFDAVVSYSWLSGSVAASVYAELPVPHIHVVLALGRSRLAAGEAMEKVHSGWLECEEHTFAQASYIVTCSEAEKADLIRFYPAVKSSKIYCIPLGIDLNVYQRRPFAPDHLVRRATDRFREGTGDDR